MAEKLEKKIKPCIFKVYCGEFHIADEEVCNGVKGDCKECGTHLYYMTQDFEKEKIRRGYFE